MLPFLIKKQQAGIAGTIMKRRTPDEQPSTEEQTQDDPQAGLEACVQDLMDALERKDVKAAAQAFQDCVSLAQDSESTDEDDKTAPAPHSYDAQNRLAAKAE